MDSLNIIRMMDSHLIGFLNRGEYQQALGYLQDNTQIIGYADSKFFKVLFQILKKEYSKANDEFITIERIELSKQELITLEILKTRLHYRLGEYGKLVTLIDKIDLYFSDSSTSDEYKNNFWLSNFMETKGFYNHLIGNSLLALKFYTSSLNYAKISKVEGLVGSSYLSIGEINIDLGDFDEAKVSLNLSIKHNAPFDNKPILGYTYQYLGEIYAKMGLYEDALESYGASRDYFNLSDIPYESIKLLNNIGQIQLLQGQIDIALKSFHILMNSALDYNWKYDLATVYHNVGMCHMRKSDFSTALNFLEKSYGIWNDLGNELEESHSLYHLINVAISNADQMKIEKYSISLNKLVSNSTNNIIVTRGKMAQANILKNKTRLRYLVEAEQIYKDLINDPEIQEFEIRINAMINLCELLFFEMKNSEDSQILVEINELIDFIEEISNTQNSTILKIEALILKSKFALIEYNMEDAYAFIQEAVELSDRASLFYHHKIALNFSNQILDEIKKWETMNIERKTVLERIEQLKIYEYLNDLQKFMKTID